jgi:hypothetical protein
MKGLYGSTLADNGYIWPTEYDWYDSQSLDGTRTTFLDAFLPTSESVIVNFYAKKTEGEQHIYFYQQNPDGN